jgi:dTDP-glucose pyrophosphorylase
VKEKIAKAVILARGLGRRMRQAEEGVTLEAGQEAVAAAGVKAMLSFGRPFLDYVLSALADAGFGRVALVVGPEHDLMREYYERTAPPRRLHVEFAIQAEPLGTADALLAAEACIGADEFVVLNSDNYYPVGALAALCEMGEPGTVLFEREGLLRGNVRPERIRDYAVAVVGEDGYLADIIEKPDEATLRAAGENPLISMNVWRLAPAFFEACRKVGASARGERELPQAIRHAIRSMGLRLKVERSSEPVLDLSRRGDVASIARWLRGVEANP